MRSAADLITVEVWAAEVAGRVLYAPAAKAGGGGGGGGEAAVESPPLTLLRGISAYTGRMAALPAWVGTGAVVGMEGGRDAVLNTTAALLAARVPIAAVWLQDWTGVRPWLPWL